MNKTLSKNLNRKSDTKH